QIIEELHHAVLLDADRRRVQLADLDRVVPGRAGDLQLRTDQHREHPTFFEGFNHDGLPRPLGVKEANDVRLVNDASARCRRYPSTGALYGAPSNRAGNGRARTHPLTPAPPSATFQLMPDLNNPSLVEFIYLDAQRVRSLAAQFDLPAPLSTIDRTA